MPEDYTILHVKWKFVHDKDDPRRDGPEWRRFFGITGLPGAYPQFIPRKQVYLLIAGGPGAGDPGTGPVPGIVIASMAARGGYGNN